MCMGGRRGCRRRCFLFDDALRGNLCRVVVDGLFKFSRSVRRTRRAVVAVEALLRVGSSSRSSAAAMIWSDVVRAAGAADVTAAGPRRLSTSPARQVAEQLLEMREGYVWRSLINRLAAGLRVHRQIQHGNGETPFGGQSHSGGCPCRLFFIVGGIVQYLSVSVKYGAVARLAV